MGHPSKPEGFCAIVVAGGAGRRFGGTTPKQFTLLGGKPVLAHTLQALDACARVSRIVLVLPGALIQEFRKTFSRHFDINKLTDIVVGGKTRQDSVRHGLKAVDAVQFPYVAIHDGVRPFFDNAWFEEGLKVLQHVPAVAVGVPPVDTIKQISSRGFVVKTPRREGLIQIQTPQMFQTAAIKAAHEMAEKKGLDATDDTMLMEQAGFPVKVLSGSSENIKITRNGDLFLAEAILAACQSRKKGGGA